MIFRPILCFALALVSLGSGCATSFKYQPQHDQAYSAVNPQLGLAIQTGLDARPASEVQPAWVKKAEKYVARAVADEIDYAKLFRRTKVHIDSVDLEKYSTILQFRILKFDCRNQAGFLESAGRDILRFQGVRGALIAESISSKYISEVEVEFTVLNASTRQTLFVKTYSANRTVTLNGYESDKPKVRQTSAALEFVVTKFVSDLSKVLSRP